MNVLMISLDNSILEPNSFSSGRMKDYGSICDELHILVLKGMCPVRGDIFNASNGASERVKISENVFAYPAGTDSRLLAVFSAIKLGKKILSAGGKWTPLETDRPTAVVAAPSAGRSLTGWIITAQDPFETGFIAWHLAKRFSLPFEIQLHGDFYGNKYWRKENILNFFRFCLGRFILRRANGVRVVSERIKKSIIEFVDAEKIKTNPIQLLSVGAGGTDLKNKFPGSFPIILSVGNLVPVKNHKLLIETFAEIKKDLPKAKLVIAGEGPLAENLRLQILDLRLENEVELAGYKDDLAGYYSSADIFVHPSLYEGWGRAAVEAAKLGLPIVMTDVGLAGEVIKNNESGLIVPINDKEALKEAVLGLAKDEALRKRLGEGARRAVSGLPDKEQYLNKIKESWEAAGGQ